MKTIRHTEVWELRPDGRRYLMNTITHGSRFHGFSVPKSISETLYTAESQMWVAKAIKSGWDVNGPYVGIYRYEIVQVWNEGDHQ